MAKLCFDYGHGGEDGGDCYIIFFHRNAYEPEKAKGVETYTQSHGESLVKNYGRNILYLW